MSKINYSFDTIKNSSFLFFVFIFIPLFPTFLLIIFHVEAWCPILPDFLVRSALIPLFVGIILSIVCIMNKKRFFWSKMDILIDEEQLTLSINDKQFSFNDLEYFDYLSGSVITAGGGRYILLLKFRGEKEKFITPCKSSKEIQNYDNFILNFDTILMNLELDQKKKSLPKTTRVILTIICFILPLLFIGLWMGKGFENAIKVLPSIFVFYGICMVHLLKRKKAN